jgi:hypothetical protein
MKKVAIALLLGAISTPFADGWEYHLTVKNIKIVASYDGGPAKGVYAYFQNQSGTERIYKYLFNASGNSLEYGKLLMSALMQAQAIGKEVSVNYKTAPADDEFFAVQF